MFCCFRVLSHIWLDLLFLQPFFLSLLFMLFLPDFFCGWLCVSVCACSRCCCLATPAFIFVAVLIIIITTAIHPFLGQFHDIASIIDFCLMRCLPFCIYPLTTHIFCCCFNTSLVYLCTPLFFFFCSICFFRASF